MPSAVNEIISDQDHLYVPVNLDLGDLVITHSQPISFGVPLPHGLRPEGGELVHGSGVRLPVQLEVLHSWPDGSVRWLLVDVIFPDGDFESRSNRDSSPFSDGTSSASSGDAAMAQSKKDLGGLWMLELTASDEERERGGEGEKGLVSESEEQLVIETGAVQFQIDRNRLRPLSQVCLNGVELLASSGCRLVVTDSSGEKHEAICDGWNVEADGPVRATLVGIGRFPKLKDLRVRVRISFFAGSGLVRVEVTAHNPNRARHPGGLWDLGDDGSLLFRDVSIVTSFAKDSVGKEVRFAIELGNTSSMENETDWRLYQDSSGGENWQSVNHVSREGIVNTTFQGYRVDSGQAELTGLRAEPTVEVAMNQGRAAFMVPKFWQEFPKAISVSVDSVRIGLFPREYEELHELQGGERKTHTVWMNFGSKESKLEELSWVHRPATIRPTAQWCDSTGCLPDIQLGESRQLADLDELFSEAVDGEHGIFAQREKVDEYGWRNYGDIFANHEEACYEEALPLISHYNNQYDMVHGFLLQYLRTGQRSWLKLGDDLARHVVDIDMYHTTQDKAAYNGGLFWLTDHYVHAHTASHRTYSKKNCPEDGNYGGGPGAEHDFTSGLLLHYFLTGNPDSEEAVVQLADWVIAMDDGRRTILGIVDDSFTGTATGSAEYQGPNRGGGFSINSLLDAWSLTRRDEYLRTAERLIRRCVHPHGDITSHDLLNVETRWSYTVFLTSVAKYLDLKAQSGQLDKMYAYAQESLLHYAQWMLQNELPYFDQVEKLEYPTEAWAVQEFRKANVLRMAAAHAEGDLRQSLLRRGEEFSERAWQDLLRFESRTNARSLAVMMIEGMTDCRLRGDVVQSAPKAEASFYTNFGEPEQFVSQKQRVKTQLKQPLGIVKAVASTLNPMRWRRYWRLRSSD